MKLELADSLNQTVRSRFLSAKSSESLVFSPTELTTVRSKAGLPFQLRYCPALSKKPGAINSGAEEPQSTPKPNPNPFETPSEDLLIARLPNDRHASHNLVLNKYPVISNHSILATAPFKRQTEFLDAQDLDVTYSCLQAWEAKSTKHSPARLFAFFNSGQHSGASQIHRHLQFLPVEDMMNTEPLDAEWEPLIDLMTERSPEKSDLLGISCLPFRHFAEQIPPYPTAGDLLRIYHNLYDLAEESVQDCNEERRPRHTAIDRGHGEASISYNFAMTTKAMAVCPRRSETAIIRTNGTEGAASLNGTILAGTLMVKEESDWHALRQGHVMIDDLLEQIGIPKLSKADAPRSTRL